MGAIFELVRKLVLLTIFASFCELLLPKSTFRSYTRLVVGLLVIAMLLQPVLELRGVPLDLEGLLVATTLTASKEELQGNTWLKEQTQELVEKQLAEQVGSFFAADYPDYEIDVALDVGYDQHGNLSEFRGMEVVLRPSSQGIEPVQPVSVGEEIASSSQPVQPETVNALARQLGIPADTLSIWVYTDGGEADG